MSASPATSSIRFARLDALRGLAIVWMVGFHFCFDLNHLGFITQNFYRDPFWTTQRTVIVSLFLFVAGLGQAIAMAQGQGWPRFWKRWAQVAGCAVLVSAGSYLVFPRSFISFGVLHGVAVMLILLRCAGGLGRWLWPLGLLALALPHLVQSTFFDTRWTNWLGLVTRLPVTEDWVPVFPWLGVMCFGLASGQWLLRARPHWLQGRLPTQLKPLCWLGQRPLTIYMLHQPVLMGLLTAIAATIKT